MGNIQSTVYDQIFAEGYAKGFAKGYAEGYAEEIARPHRQTLDTLVRARFPRLYEELLPRMQAIPDLEVKAFLARVLEVHFTDLGSFLDRELPRPSSDPASATPATPPTPPRR